METSLTVLYTQRLRGRLSLLPCLYAFLRGLRAEHAAGQPVLLLDLGESCAAEVFPCALTGGRSMLIALDAMGYDAARVDEMLRPEERARLGGSHLSMVLVDAAHAYIKQDMLLSTAHTDSALVPLGARGVITLSAAAETYVDAGVLHLRAVEAGEVGMARVVQGGHSLRLMAEQTFVVPDTVVPDATIAATVEFILSEARYLERKQTSS
jgi:hypothetical protein